MTQTHTRSIRALMFILRCVMPHQLKDVENVRLQEGEPIVYLCNHGEMYGPIAGMLYCPGFVRPWTISELCCGPEEATAYVKRYTLKKVNWADKTKQRVAAFLAKNTLKLIRAEEVLQHDTPCSAISPGS